MRSRPMPTAPDCAISGSSSGSSRLACSSTASPSSVSAGSRRSLAKRCRSRAKAVTARRAAASVSGGRVQHHGAGRTVHHRRCRQAGSHAPGQPRPAPPARRARAASPRYGRRRRPPRSPRRRAATDRAAPRPTAAATSLISTAPSGRPAKLRNGERVRLRTSRRPISRTSSARRVRLGAVVRRHAGLGLRHDRRGDRLGLGHHRALGRQQGLLDPPPHAADQPRRAQHADIGVDQRRQFGLALLGQHGEPLRAAW